MLFLFLCGNDHDPDLSALQARINWKAKMKKLMKEAVCLVCAVKTPLNSLEVVEGFLEYSLELFLFYHLTFSIPFFACAL